jgi:hypothetical protein
MRKNAGAGTSGVFLTEIDISLWFEGDCECLMVGASRACRNLGPRIVPNVQPSVPRLMKRPSLKLDV